jgi:hypothetical protein
MAVTVLLVIQASPLFEIDHVQRQANDHSQSAWISQFAVYWIPLCFLHCLGILGLNIQLVSTWSSPILPEVPYCVNIAMLYDLQRVLKLSEQEDTLSAEHQVKLPGA